MNNIGFYVIPLILAAIILTATIKKVPVFDTFLEGAKEGMESTFLIAPSLIGLITAVAMLKASGALDIFSKMMCPLTNLIGLPAEIAPLAMLRPISGSGSLALLNNILKNNGPDSFVGNLASVIMGSTETTFYTLAVYFGSIGIKNSKNALLSALTADLTAIVAALAAVKYLMNNF